VVAGVALTAVLAVVLKRRRASTPEG
jgi:hypothetical protein